MKAIWILQALYLLGSGAFAAAGFVLFAAGGFFNISQTIANGFLLTVAVHAFGATVGVFGADRRVLSSADEFSGALRYSRGFIFWNLAVGATVSIYLSISFDVPVFVAALLGCAVCFDSYSVLVQTWLSKRGQAQKVMWANLLRYPLFFLMIYIVGLVSPLELESTYIAFALSSVVRVVYLYLRAPRPTKDHSIEVDLNFYAGFYQGINFLIFRGGQLLAGSAFAQIGSAQLAGVLGAWKLVEFVDKVFVYLMPAVLGLLNTFFGWRRAFLVLCFSVSGVLVFLLSNELLGMPELDSGALFLITIHVMLLLPVNVLVLNGYRLKKYALILKMGVLSLLFGSLGFLMVYFWYGSTLALLAWSPLALVFLSALILRATEKVR